MIQGYEVNVTRCLARLSTYPVPYDSYHITSILVLLGVARCEKVWKQRVYRRKKVSTPASEDSLVLGDDENPRRPQLWEELCVYRVLISILFQVALINRFTYLRVSRSLLLLMRTSQSNRNDFIVSTMWQPLFHVHIAVAMIFQALPLTATPMNVSSEDVSSSPIPTESYFREHTSSNLLYVHIIFMFLGWVGALPICMFPSKSNASRELI